QVHEIQYAGGMLLDLNRHELYYQFDFTVKYEITETDTRQQDDLDGLPDLKTLSIDVDFIEPGTGPDGDIEHHTEITFQE
ncbi:phage tail terminator protein, partial [Salmonella enterica subsp. enterica serovar 4,[5],12:i:-]